jgi:two-component system, NtrC family, sensor kinase
MTIQTTLRFSTSCKCNWSSTFGILTLLLLSFVSVRVIGQSAEVVNLSFWKGVDVSVQDALAADQFKEVRDKVPNFGISTETIFLKFDIVNLQGADSDLWLYIDNPLLDVVKLYEYYDEPVLVGSSGESVKFIDRRTSAPGPIFSLSQSHRTTRTFIIEVSSVEHLVIPIAIGTKDYFDDRLHNNELFYAAYFGLMLVMILYNLFVYFSVRDRLYVNYIFYIAAVGLTQFILGGYANKYLWPNSDVIPLYASTLVPISSGITTILFTRVFIQTARFSPVIDKILKFYLVSYIVAAVVALMGYGVVASNVINFNAASALILVPAAINAIRQGYRPAVFFLIAWVIFLIGVTLMALKNFGLIPASPLSNFAVTVGSGIEATLLSFALADRINQFKKEKEESQQQAITVMRENQKLIEEQNVRLEKMVQERTEDLEKSNTDLSITLNNLRLTQKQLVESEKLASLGQMTAGIAHEINNPINFVQSNVQPLKRDIDDVMQLLEAYYAVNPEENNTSNLLALRARYKELDMDYLKKEISQLMGGIEEGAKRTAEIVRALRVFSRMDRDTAVTASVNDCITSTLVVMKSITKGEVTIEKSLEEEIPQILCYPGKLNQVLMNVLTNAVQATKAKGIGPDDRKVGIRSFSTEKDVQIEVIDNGIGIPEDVKSKIFDPFFTTKGVGEGTGLGLSIAMGIIVEHNGHISVDSNQGEGTRILITLPRS